MIPVDPSQVLLESTKAVVGTPVASVPNEPRPQLLAFSASHPETVRANTGKNLHYLSKYPYRVGDASYTLACRRRMHCHRAFVLGSVAFWDISPVQKVGPPPDLVLVFSGQGAQYPGMARELINANAVARNTIQLLDDVLNSLEPGRSWSIRGETSRLSEFWANSFQRRDHATKMFFTTVPG